MFPPANLRSWRIVRHARGRTAERFIRPGAITKRHANRAGPKLLGNQAGWRQWARAEPRGNMQKKWRTDAKARRFTRTLVLLGEWRPAAKIHASSNYIDPIKRKRVLVIHAVR